ncbi:MAG: aminotransferase class I/II-fold pyridoxal phosphate-dependent enzyme, partial [Clostridia bacterium]|nr:aminotransferase class I/II-fold pyridoxal phosphate-dependent enzyme [Clostridia bacterium]
MSGIGQADNNRVACSDRLEHVHSDIRGPLYQEALRMEAKGEKVLKLNTGNPARFGFTLPESVRSALALHVDEAAPYCDVRGMKNARDVICTYHIGRGLQGITPDDVFICNGVSEAASMIMNALIGTDDEILLPTPCYSLWSNNAYLCGGRPVFYRCDPGNHWNPDVEDIKKKITGKTKAILIINPNNPTGAVYSHEILLAIAAIAREHRLVLLSDELFDRLVMDGLRHESVGALAPDLPCVTFNGLSKSHIICGFRCGWMVFSGPKGRLDEVKNGVMKLAAMRLCGNALTQLVIPAALADSES